MYDWILHVYVACKENGEISVNLLIFVCWGPEKARVHLKGWRNWKKIHTYLYNLQKLVYQIELESTVLATHIGHYQTPYNYL